MNFEVLFNESYARVFRDDETGDRFFAEFYERFLASSPEIQRKFEHTDLEKQRRMLKQSLQHMLSFFTVREASDYMRGIARLHSQSHHDIAPHLYDVWLHSLIETVKDTDPRYTRDVGLAWKMIMSMGITYMTDMYDQS